LIVSFGLPVPIGHVLARGVPMSEKSTEHPRRTSSKRRWRAGGLVAALILALGVPAPGMAPAAGTCSIETHGQSAYARVKQKIEAKFYKSPDVIVEPYTKVQISLQPDCVFELNGRFSVKVRGSMVRKVYDAKVTPKNGAPHGMKILKLRVSSP
jgi:hypothetical protein